MMTLRRIIGFGSALALVAVMGHCSDNSTNNNNLDMSTGGGDMSTDGGQDLTSTGGNDMPMGGGQDLSGTNPDGAGGNPDGAGGGDMSMPPDMAKAPAPTITAIVPVNGSNAGGTLLTITGTNFQMGAAVTVGGVACIVTTTTATQITCTTGAKAATCGLQVVVVTNPDMQTATNTGNMPPYSFFAKGFAFGNFANIADGFNSRSAVTGDFNRIYTRPRSNTHSPRQTTTRNDNAPDSR